jgi:putative ABC transport system permease protein
VSGWRPALRIARRSIRRNLGRSLLVAVLVGLPVAAATMVDVVARTLYSPERDAAAALGVADAAASVSVWSRLESFQPTPWGSEAVGAGKPDRDPEAVDLAALLPPGSHVAPTPRRYLIGLTEGERGVRAQLVLADPREPLHRHEAKLEEGRVPTRPGEVLISPSLADRMSAGIGSRVHPADGPPLTVTGIAEAPFCISCEQLVALPGSSAARLVEGDEPINLSTDGAEYLVDLPPSASAEALWPALAKQGVGLTPREAYLHPDRYEGVSSGPGVQNLRDIAMAMLISGLGLLEVVLLAGAAFAVGARRQTRELGLVGASGGSARHVCRIVLAQGLVLGAFGALLGVAFGALVAVAGRPLWEHLENARIMSWSFGPYEIAGAALIGLLSGLAAAVIPAIGAGRMRPVDALAERFRTSRSARRRTATAGIVLMVAGVLLALGGDRLLADDFAAYARELKAAAGTGNYIDAPSPGGPMAMIVGGALLIVAGLVVLAPAVIAGLASPAARMPLSLRLAMRDAARHRHRTGPATSAIAVAVAGSVVLAFVLVGNLRAEELRYVPSLPPHVLAVSNGETDTRGMEDAARQASAELPGATALTLREPLNPVSEGQSASYPREMYLTPAGDACEQGCVSGSPAIAGDDDLNELVAGRALSAGERKALAAGTSLVFDRSLLDDGSIRVEVASDGAELKTVDLPARLVRRETFYTSLPSALIPLAAAREQGWDVEATRVLIPFDAGMTADQVDSARAAAERFGASTYVEEGPDDDSREIALLIVAGVAGFVTLVGVAISVALSAAEGRADLATLGAVGAPPRRRRALAAAQALLVAGVGCALGVAFGTFVAYAARTTTGSPDFVVPWANLGILMLAVPLLAVAVAAVFTPSRLPLARRAT